MTQSCMVWKRKNYKKLGKKSKKKNSKFISFEMKNQPSKDSYGCDSIWGKNNQGMYGQKIG